MPNLPDFAAAKSDLDVKAVVDQFFGSTLVSGPAGGVVEEVCVEALDEPAEVTLGGEPGQEPRSTEEVIP